MPGRANNNHLTDWLIHRLRSKDLQEGDIIIVSGLPRSGTSMMMKMLEAGGVPLVTDHQREADENNPLGYSEFERVKGLPAGDIAWLQDAPGKAVKVISALLTYLPSHYYYRVIFMQRPMDEVLASQRQMLARRGMEVGKVDDAKMAEAYEQHLESVHQWMAEQRNIQVLPLLYNEILRDPDAQIETINQFLSRRLDLIKMRAVIDPRLYRQRRTNG